ncbi:YsnF/AvaK domain-containing protein [Paracraurococcus lichenis]|uniref:DUF2382 domain-containing protein n=1 Tax=Paracraurococcus lichenis TaxID=3064888 RepID=A0ABT9E286_9PROT|nr:DUF2382 domain-containing protein [Paracraurococcus sp. LOR1-02]MDO9710286.1 DUF2382 domain-containing protein [Paracraurococcus sp. LOR1-02]
MAAPERTGRLVEEKVVPVIEETAVVYKEQVVTDRVRLHKRVHEDQEVLDIPVRTETLEVERVPMGRWIEAAPAIRQEGETTVYSVVEEVLVVEKRLRLVEEVRVTRRQATRHVREEVALRREEVTVEHAAAPRDPARDKGAAADR